MENEFGEGVLCIVETAGVVIIVGERRAGKVADRDCE
jgi:hypothetical protein